MVKIMLLIVSLSLIIECNNLTDRYVIETRYEPTAMIPHTVVDCEDYCVTIKGRYKDEERTETIYVTKSQYECLNGR